jgi:hypothetical protein
MALWGFLGGALGFPGGQCLQAFHAWNPEVFNQGIWIELDQHMNWWNNMETTFGAVMGATLGLGLWRNRAEIQPATCDEEDNLPVWGEILLLAIHIPILVGVEFAEIRFVDSLYGLGLVMVAIPVVAISGGRWWPTLQILPLILIPIAGKTLKDLAFENQEIGVSAGWMVYVILPLSITTVAALLQLKKPESERDGVEFVRWTLLLNIWVYYLLNFAFFRFPWPWAEWTARTPNNLVFTLCLVGLTLLCLLGRRNEKGGEAHSS